MWFCEEGHVIGEDRQREMMGRVVEEARARIAPSIDSALLLPPDITRYHSGSGELTNMLYHILEPECRTDVIPTLAQHVPHTGEENRRMFGDIPEERIHVHDWRTSCRTLGEVDREFVAYATDGLVDEPLPIEMNRAVVEGGYDLVVSVGQVVPHEVLGFANHNKNLFVGLGGESILKVSHMVAAICGIEDTLGQIITPLRGCYNVAERDYLQDVPKVYVLVVRTHDEGGALVTTGLYVGEDVEAYVRAAQYAREHTIHALDRAPRKVVCVMDAEEYRSTWVANKAIYRTRMAIADGGELIVIAPGVERFGEQADVDEMIRRYGYRGTPHTLDAYRDDPEMREMGHAAAHLIHGASEGRFDITYAPGRLTREEVEGVGFGYMDLEEALAAYPIESLEEGFNMVNGEEVFFIGSPSMGLWTGREKFVSALEVNRSFAERMVAREPEEAVWQRLRGWDEEDIANYGV